MQAESQGRNRARPIETRRDFQRFDIGLAVFWVYPIVILLSDWVLMLFAPYGLILYAALIVALTFHYVVLAPAEFTGWLLPALALLPITRLILAVVDQRLITKDFLPFFAAAPLVLVLTSAGIITLLRAYASGSPAAQWARWFAQPRFTSPRFELPAAFAPGRNPSGLGASRPIGRLILNGLIQFGIALSGVAIGYMFAVLYGALGYRALGVVAHASGMMRLDAVSGPNLLFSAGLVLLAVCEELVFRGLVLKGARSTLGRAGKVFAAVVWMASGMSFVSPVYMVSMFALGLLFSMVVEWSGSIWGVALAHAAANITMSMWPAITSGTLHVSPSLWLYALVVSAGVGVLSILLLAWRPGRASDTDGLDYALHTRNA